MSDQTKEIKKSEKSQGSAEKVIPSTSQPGREIAAKKKAEANADSLGKPLGEWP